jgi:hypothetical protein
MVALAVGMGIASVSAAVALDLPWRDPDGTLGPSYIRLPAIVLGAFLADVLPRAVYRARGLRRAWPHARAVVRQRWTRGRVVLVLVGVACFYLSYVSYRVLKGYLPFIREDLNDEQLAQLDQWLSFGRPPSDVLHDLLGTGVSAHVLSLIYVGYLLFVPLSLAVWLVWSRNLAGGVWYATALCANWTLGLASYYLVPSQGPIFAEPSLFWDLPDTGVSALQAGLWNTRWFAITDPQGYEGVFSIAGFASLHVSVVFTAALLAHMTIRTAWIRWAMWAFLATTVLATVYFGWHYIADDVAGIAIGWIALWMGAKASGHSMRASYRGQIFGPGPQTARPAVPVGVGAEQRSTVG